MRYRWPAVGAIVALVLLAAVVARGASAVPVGQGRPLFGFLSLPRLEFPATASETNQDRLAEPSAWVEAIGWIVLLLPLVLLAVVIVAALVVGLTVRRRRRIGPATPLVPGAEPAEDVPAHQLLTAAREARQILRQRAGAEPSDAVIAAWVRLEQAAADTGRHRRAHETPTEFTDALLARDESVRGALDQLRRLYQRARFSTSATVGAAEADAARAALDEIVRSLSHEPVPS